MYPFVHDPGHGRDAGRDDERRAGRCRAATPPRAHQAAPRRPGDVAALASPPLTGPLVDEVDQVGDRVDDRLGR